MSFEEARQFTNQMAYQSMFSPPGFSFESPFAYSSMPTGNGTDGQSSSFPMNMPIQQSLGMDMDAEMKRPGSSGGGMQIQPVASTVTSGFGSLGGSVADGNMWAVAPQPQGSQQIKKEQGMIDLFSTPPVQLSTGDRFSQLLERKLGMGAQTPSSVYPSYNNNNPSSAGQSRQVGSMPMTFPSFPSALSHDSFSWDRLAVETNLQDYNQIQIQPDLVAPIPAAYLQYNSTPMMANYDSNTSQGYMRTGVPFPNCGVNGFSPMQQQHFVPPPNPYLSFQDGYGGQAMANPSFSIQASPMSTSNKSSPSSQSHQLATPQTSSMMSDGSWSSSFAPQSHLAPSDGQNRQHPGTVPAPPYGRAPATIPRTTKDHAHMHPSYQQVRQLPEPSVSAPPIAKSERNRPAGMGNTLPPAPRPIAIKQTQSHPALAVGPNGMWPPLEMVASSSSHSINRSHSHQSYTMSSNLPSSSQAVQRGQSHIVHPLPLPLPVSLPPAPTVAKRARSHSSSPKSHGSSSLSHYSPNQNEASLGLGPNSTSKRPKMSMSIPQPMSSLSNDEHGDEDGERKVVIACHTCRARKLKCDGGRPKCFHCSRRNEDGCSYDVVLRRRGPGRKNKSKQKSTEGGSEGSIEDDHSH